MASCPTLDPRLTCDLRAVVGTELEDGAAPPYVRGVADDAQRRNGDIERVLASRLDVNESVRPFRRRVVRISADPNGLPGGAEPDPHTVRSRVLDLTTCCCRPSVTVKRTWKLSAPVVRSTAAASVASGPRSAFFSPQASNMAARNPNASADRSFPIALILQRTTRHRGSPRTELKARCSGTGSTWWCSEHGCGRSIQQGPHVSDGFPP